MRGERIGVHAMREPDSGPPRAARARAERRGNGDVRNGSKTSVQFSVSHLTLVFATDDRSKGMWRMTATLVDRVRLDMHNIRNCTSG